MTKQEKQVFDALVRQVANRWCPFDNYDTEEEWDEFYKKVFRLDPDCDVLMRYECSLFDLARG